MNNRIYLLILGIIALAFISYPAKAGIEFDETYNFNGGGTLSEAVATWESVGGSTASSLAAINQLFVDFNDAKIISEIRAPNTYLCSAGGCPVTSTFLLNAAATGLNQKWVVFNSTIFSSGTWYGNGTIGWVRDSGNNYHYVITFLYVNTNYAKTLSSTQEIVLTYDKTVFTTYITSSNAGNDVGANSTPNYFRIATTMHSDIQGNRFTSIAINTQYLDYTIDETARLIFNNNTVTNTGFVNLSKNSGNMRFMIQNLSGNNFYDITSSSDVSENTLKSGGILAKIFEPLTVTWVNRTLYLPAGIYNVNFNKTNYNLNEDLNISWSNSNTNYTLNNYYLKLYDGTNTWLATYGVFTDNGYWIPPPVYDRTKIDTFKIYLTSSLKSSPSISTTLDSDTAQYGIFYDEVVGNFTTNKSNYNRSENIGVYFNLSNSGKLIFSGICNEYQYNLNAGNNQVYNFFVPDNECIGQMTIFLQYYNGINYVTLNHKVINILPVDSLSYVQFEHDNINSGSSENVRTYSNTSGYVSILSPNNEIKFNQTINANTMQTFVWYSSFDYPEGNYIANLYNSTGKIVSSDMIFLNTDVKEPSPTLSVTVISTPSSFLDIGSELSNVIIGNTDADNNGDITTTEIKNKGNHIFNFLLMMVLIILVVGTYEKLK